MGLPMIRIALAIIIAALAFPAWADAIDDARTCSQRTGDVDEDIAVCTRAIEAGELSQANLASGSSGINSMATE